MQTLGVPYPEGYDEQAVEDLLFQGGQIAADLKNSGIEVSPTSYMVAMIALTLLCFAVSYLVFMIQGLPAG